jgi:hypothetical protein
MEICTVASRRSAATSSGTPAATSGRERSPGVPPHSGEAQASAASFRRQFVPPVALAQLEDLGVGAERGDRRLQPEIRHDQGECADMPDDRPHIVGAGVTLTIVRELDATQETDFVENEALPTDSLENAMDKLTMLVQQFLAVAGRSILVPKTGAITKRPFKN